MTAPSPLLQSVASRHQATLGVYVRHLGTNVTMELNADQVFRSASLYKLFVLYEVFTRIENGTLNGSEILTMSPKALENEPYAEWPVGTRTSVDCATSAMVTISSNAAAAMLLERVGGEPVVTANMRARGYTGTEITVERAFTTARDVGRLLEEVATDRAISPGASAAIRRLLLAQRHNDRLPLPLPTSVAVGHKTGELTRLRHDAGVVYARHGSYVMVAMADQAPSAAAARDAVLDLSREVYARFEPNSLATYLGLPPRLAQEVFRLPDTQGRLDALNDGEAMTVPLAGTGVALASTAERSRLREVVLPDLLALQRAAEQANSRFWVHEGYRPVEDKDLTRMVHNPILPVGCTVEIPTRQPSAERTSEEAEAAEPAPRTPSGPSQHWLGTVIAVSDSSDRDAVAGGTPPNATSEWLAANAWRFGLIPALPETEQTVRIGYEPWRLRWVGREMAAQIREATPGPAYAERVRTALLQAQADLAMR